MTKEEAISIISGYEVYGCGFCLQGDEEIEEALRLAVDALKREQVVRCKDCKYHYKKSHWADAYPLSLEEGAKIKVTHYDCEINQCTCPRDDDYCSRAKRKE